MTKYDINMFPMIFFFFTNGKLDKNVFALDEFRKSNYLKVLGQECIKTMCTLVPYKEDE